MEIEQTRDTIVSKLTSAHGEDLEITANITNSGQINAVLEGLVSKCLGSRVGEEEYELLLRLTDSWHGRCRDDPTGIGKTPDAIGWKATQSNDN